MTTTNKTIAGFKLSSPEEAAQFEPLVLAKSRMLAKFPFFAALMMDRMTVRLCDDDAMPTCATDGRYIIINPEFFESLGIHEQVFALCHEVGHAMFRHMPRAKEYQTLGFRGTKFLPRLYNVAGDYVINDLLVQGSVGAIRDEWLHNPDKYTGDMHVDDVYWDLFQQLPPEVQQGMKDLQEGKLPGAGDGQGSFDEHLEPEGHEDIESMEWKEAIAAAAQAAKMVGNLPANLEKFIDSVLEPEVNWRDELRTSVVRCVGRDTSTWAKPNRRRLYDPGVYTPGVTGYGAGEVWVWMDTSGSISQSEYMAYFAELTEILSTCHPEALFLGFCDAAVNKVVRLDMPEELDEWTKKIPGGGGTDFRPPWSYMKKNGARPDVVVYLTDMYGPFPDDSPWQTIWVATSDQQAPFGKTIQLKLAA